ncbi:MAG: dihydrodipicolinate synthase family protein [Bryobacteraceae bacterium]
MKPLEGILPAVVTPLDDQGRFCPAAFERLLEALYGSGVHGIYVCGNTGEGLAQSAAQRMQVAEAAVRCSPKDKLVIIHVGAHELDDAVKLARHAERIGASAISSLPPLKGSTAADVTSYYRSLTSAASLPFLLYYFPGMSPVIAEGNLAFDLLALPNVAGLKFTDFDLYRLGLLRRRGAVVFNGRDEVLAAGLLMGANGGIGSFYNVAPELFLMVYRLGREGRWEEARPIQTQINELVEIGLRFPLLSATKRMLAWSGLDCGRCVPGSPEMTARQESELRAALAASSLAGQSFTGLRIS